jgi:uncharacterized repeat protein (TIGR02543 family)
MPAEDITLYAKWTTNTYTINFNSNGGNTVTPITDVYGTNVSAPTIPTKTGYTFLGWYSDVAFSNAYTFSTMPAEDITLYAKWTIDVGSDLRLEAENGTLYGGAEIESSASASNGEHAGYIQAPGDGVSFTNLNASNSIILCYAGWVIAGQGTISLYVTRGETKVKVGTILLTETGSYTAYAIVKIDGLNLIDGDTLSFQYDSGDCAFNIDYIAYNTSDTFSIVTVQP